MADKDPARARYYLMAGHRLVGAVMLILGMAVFAGGLDWGTPVGLVLLFFGFLDFLVVPTMLARRWRSPSE
ncbi:hypothetical protein [Qipengyuania sp.]|uniref:hypothetical protein n=1 Tax=Qipengyuania sp. TaxID=2004515 RepID=UPI0035C7FAFB